MPLATLADDREAHFNRLREAPDLYLELQIQKASAYRIESSARHVGYCIAAGNSLLEFELDHHAWPVKERLFAEVWAALGLEEALCLSFDSLLVGLCVSRGLLPEIVGALFRERTDDEGPEPKPGLALRAATFRDVEQIEPHREGVFDDGEQIAEYIERGCLHTLEERGTFVGIGLLTPIWPSRDERDLGVMVHPDFRGRGYATYVLRSLKRLCLEQGLRPIAGCAAGNAASKSALVRSGFTSQHTLLCFGLPDRAR